MKIEDVRSLPRRERRSCRANLRLYPSQMKFIRDQDISIQAIFDKALDELGHVIPAPEEIENIACRYVPRESRGHGRGRKVAKHRRR